MQNTRNPPSRPFLILPLRLTDSVQARYEGFLQGCLQNTNYQTTEIETDSVTEPKTAKLKDREREVVCRGGGGRALTEIETDFVTEVKTERERVRERLYAEVGVVGRLLRLRWRKWARLCCCCRLRPPSPPVHPPTHCQHLPLTKTMEMLLAVVVNIIIAHS